MRKVIAAMLAGTVLFAGGIALGLRMRQDGGAVAGPGTAATPPGDGEPQLVLTSALRPFDDCEALTAHYRDIALEMVGPYGLGGFGYARAGEDVSMEAAGEAAVPAPAADAGAAVGPGETGTNVQEAGVDEPDVVKTNGELILAVANNRLQVVAPGAEPRLLSTLALPEGWQHELLVDGDRALVLTLGEGRAVPLAADAASFLPAGASVLTAVDLTDPSAPRVDATLTLDGSYRSARVVDGIARIVVSSQPAALPLVTPQAGGLRAEREALERNRQIIREAEETDWLPWSILEDGDGTVVREGPLLECGDVARPEGFTGLGTLSIITVDLSEGLTTRTATGVVAQGETVYASAERLYVATTDWVEPRLLVPDLMPRDRPVPDTVPVPDPVTTSIHAFDVTDPARARYVASGSVQGRLLNSYAMSADAGYLRVATTTEPVVWGGGELPASSSSVVVLEERGDELAEVGRLDGLGQTETIRGVRFLGDLAAVVTFRQTDPLFLIDLADPAAPALLGELKIPGYSAYLHPVGEDRLLGIGQEGTEDGTLLGVQASLFDIADRTAPARVDTVEFGQGWAEVESDPRAFLYWPDASLAVVPFQGYEGGQSVTAGIRVTGGSLERVDIPAPAAGGVPVRRALVVDGVLYTVSEAGIQASDLETLTAQGSVAFR